MSADFSKLNTVMREALEAHADRDGLTALGRAVFLARGGHALGERCPTAPKVRAHAYYCGFGLDSEECVCGASRGSEESA